MYPCVLHSIGVQVHTDRHTITSMPTALITPSSNLVGYARDVQPEIAAIASTYMVLINLRSSFGLVGYWSHRLGLLP
jgi:hypothetical protein